MAHINEQTKQILGQKDITSTDKTLGNVEALPVETEPSSLEERTQNAIDQGIYSPDLRNKFEKEIIGNMFGDPTGGLKYQKGTDDDKTFETGRLKGMPLEQLFDEYQYWNEEAQNIWNLDEDAGMNVKDWFSKMFERLGLRKEEPKGKETELLKGSDYYPPQP